MSVFLGWFNSPDNLDPVLKAGVAHFWFVTIHPFEDGNGRIARVIADLLLREPKKHLTDSIARPHKSKVRSKLSLSTLDLCMC